MTTQPHTATWLPSLRIRTATSADLPALEWEGEFSHFRRLYQDVYRSSVKGEAILWVADLPGSSLIGQLFVQLNSARPELADGHTRAYIYGFRVRPFYRDKGVGTRLLQVAESNLIHRGFLFAVLNVNQENSSARRLYERLGYRIVASEAGRWSYLDQFGHLQRVNEPAWRMEKLLKNPSDVKDSLD